MKSKKIFKSITIALTIAIVILDIILFVNMKQAYDLEKIFTTVFDFAIFIYGLLLLPILWVQYFLILGSVKVYNKYSGIKKWIFTSLLAIIEIVLLVVEIRIISIIFLFMGILN